MQQMHHKLEEEEKIRCFKVTPKGGGQGPIRSGKGVFIYTLEHCIIQF